MTAMGGGAFGSQPRLPTEPGSLAPDASFHTSSELPPRRVIAQPLKPNPSTPKTPKKHSN